MPVDNAPGHVENLWTFCGLFAHPQPDGDFSRADAQFPQSGAPSARQLALNESAFCGSVSSEGRTAPTDTTLVAHITPLGTNGAVPSMPVSKTTRYEVLRRDNHTCRYCGASAPEAKLTIDHVTPVALGGSDSPSNLVAACQDCNYGKGKAVPDAPLVEDVKQTDLKWSGAIKRVAAARERQHRKADRYLVQFLDSWQAWTRINGETCYLPGDWKNTIRRFYELGVPIEEVDRLVDRTLGNDRVTRDQEFRYLCGCLWRTVSEMQEAAKELLDSEAADGA